MAEDESLASVSTLRSRFEQLASTEQSQASTASTPSTPSTSEQPRLLRPTLTGEDPFVESRDATATSSRPSLDVPRDHEAARELGRNTLPRRHPNPARQRPVSVYSTFSPPKSPPSFRVDTPLSPPPLNLGCIDRSPNRTPLETGLVTPSPNSQPPRFPSRPTSLSPRFRNGRTPPPPPASPKPPGRPVSMFNTGTIDIGSIIQRAPPPPAPHEPPPIPARTTKPKIASRPPAPPIPSKSYRSNSVPPTPTLAPAPPAEEGVSPFSTPPTSANNSPTRSEAGPSLHSRPQQPPRKIVLNFPSQSLQFDRPVERNDELDVPIGGGVIPPPRRSPPLRRSTEKSWERNGGADSLSRNVVLPPPRMSLDQVRPRMKMEDSIRGQRQSVDDAGSRPDLPPRPTGLIGGVRARMNRGRSHSPPKVVEDSTGKGMSFLPPPKRVQIPARGKSPTNGNDVTPYSDDSNTGGYGDDSDEEGADDQSGLSDYPDSSQANRRRPYFKEGLSEIPCKTDVKFFAVCGQYVCTISHSTKVWDISTGRCIMALQQGEGVKVTALAFKPSAKVENEGSLLWLGTSHGELMEVDIPSQRILDTRSSAHTRKEVIKIHRSGFQLWSLDASGKLQVWTPDQNGSPNLRNSPITFRIHPRHTCSIVVDGFLWVGAGKGVDVYKPTQDPNRAFNVSSRQLLPTKQAGEVTCAAIVNSQPDKVYFGHSDGKISVYSRFTLNCLDVLSISLYKINSMSGVGDYLWAGFKTGMVYVYDVRPKPWRVLKDWHCSDGPIMDVIGDRTSVWMNGRLQVVSLGADNIIRIWDGMMQEDWLENAMQESDKEFCSFRQISALVCSWNAGACKPQDLLKGDTDKKFLEDVLGSAQSPDIVVFGFQELVDLEDKKITARSFLKGSKKKRAADHQEQMKHQYKLWQQQLTKIVDGVSAGSRESYHLLHVANLVGLFTCMFIKSSERDNIRNVSAAPIKRGLGGLHGNKGALVVRFLIDDSSLCFINCHLAAGQSHVISRNNDIAAILEAPIMPIEESAKARTDSFVGGGDGSMILDHEICILNGDLNYRIDVSRDSAIHKVKNNDLSALLEKDQLLVERRRNPGFRLRVFNEMPLTFAPTYKYDVGTDVYDTSEKKRIPAWCDRLLYRGHGKIKQTQYRRWEVKASDHRPISGVFQIEVKTVDQLKRKRMWELCNRRYEEVRQKLVLDAKMDYLVNICGYREEEARRTLNRKDDVGDAVASLENRRR